jgi:hypothetical protein
MYIFIVGENQPLDENSKNNPLKALVRLIEQSAEYKKKAEQAWEEQTQAMNLRLKKKTIQAAHKVDLYDNKLMEAEMKQMQVIKLVPAVHNYLQN